MDVPISVSNISNSNISKHGFKWTDSSQESAYKTFKINGKSLKITIHSGNDQDYHLINHKVLEEIAKLSLEFGIAKKNVKSLHFKGTFEDPTIEKSVLKNDENGQVKSEVININMKHYSDKASKLDKQNPSYEDKKDRLIEKQETLKKIGFLWQKLFYSDYVLDDGLNEDEEIQLEEMYEKDFNDEKILQDGFYNPGSYAIDAQEDNDSFDEPN